MKLVQSFVGVIWAASKWHADDIGRVYEVIPRHLLWLLDLTLLRGTNGNWASQEMHINTSRCSILKKLFSVHLKPQKKSIPFIGF